MFKIGAATYTFADLAYVILPIAIIWKLNMSMNRRIGLIFLLGVSAFTAFTPIMKTIVATSGVSHGRRRAVQSFPRSTIVFTGTGLRCLLGLCTATLLRS